MRPNENNYISDGEERRSEQSILRTASTNKDNNTHPSHSPDAPQKKRFTPQKRKNGVNPAGQIAFANKNKRLRTSEQELAANEHVNEARAILIAANRQLNEARERFKAAWEQALAHREKRLEAWVQALSHREKRLEAREQALAHREKRPEASERALVPREKRVEYRQQELAANRQVHEAIPKALVANRQELKASEGGHGDEMTNANTYVAYWLLLKVPKGMYVNRRMYPIAALKKITEDKWEEIINYGIVDYRHNTTLLYHGSKGLEKRVRSKYLSLVMIKLHKLISEHPSSKEIIKTINIEFHTLEQKRWYIRGSCLKDTEKDVLTFHRIIDANIPTFSKLRDQAVYKVHDELLQSKYKNILTSNTYAPMLEALGLNDKINTSHNMQVTETPAAPKGAHGPHCHFAIHKHQETPYKQRKECLSRGFYPSTSHNMETHPQSREPYQPIPSRSQHQVPMTTRYSTSLFAVRKHQVPPYQRRTERFSTGGSPSTEAVKIVSII